MKAPSSRTLYELVLEQTERGPQREAIVTSSGRLDYGAWAESSGRIAAGFRQLGLRRGNTLGLLMDNRAEWLQTYMAASALGVALAAFNTWVKPKDLEFLLRHSAAEVLVAIEQVRSQDLLAQLRTLVPELWHGEPGRWRSRRFPELREVLLLGDETPPGARNFRAWLAGCPDGFSPLPPGAGASAHDVAIVVYTSGSTARPKAVPLQHYALVENGFNIGERQGLRSSDRVWLSSPLFWSFGSANALMATLTHNAALVLQPSFEPGEALRLIESERCTAVYTLPNITHALVEHPEFRAERTRSLRTGVTIGGPDEVRLAAEVLGAASICNIYGSTETYGNCCVTPHDWPLDARMHSQGPPLPGMAFRIVDPTTREAVAAGQVGELEVSGYLTPGYLGDPALNASAFMADGHFRTGDLGWLGEGGRFHFVAREQEMIKTGGINVSPLEVEEFLSTHPAVQEVAVAGAPHPVRGETVVAFVRLRSSPVATANELRGFCRENLARYKVPELVVLCDAFPMTDTGKLARRELRKWAERALDRAAHDDEAAHDDRTGLP